MLRYHVRPFFFLSQISSRSVLHFGPGNEKQTRTLTDAEDCCENVCIVLICGWSVDVLCQQESLKKKHAEHAVRQAGTLARSKTRKIHLWSTWRLHARKVKEENASLESNGPEEDSHM